MEAWITGRIGEAVDIFVPIGQLMSLALQKKLRLTSGTTIRTINAPANYAKTIGALSKGTIEKLLAGLKNPSGR